LQRPTLLHEPPEAVDFTLSDIAVEFAESIGLELDEWQRWLVRMAFARRADRLWAARDVGIEVTRQSGKNVVLEVIELAGVFLLGDRLIVHSAHRADVSHEHFLSMRARIESCDDLMDAMPTSRANNGFITTNGNESIELANGNRILFKARAQASGRGPRPQKIVFDEALVLAQAQIGSMAPGISAQKNPQLIFASSSPKADSAVLHSLRARALEPDAGDRLFYAAWNNPPDTDPTDQEAMYRVNPSLGYGRMTEESLLANRKLMSAAEYLREHMGVPDEPVDVTVSGVIPDEVWSALADPGSQITSNLCIALDVAPDRKWAAFGSAGRRTDGRLHVEIVDRRPGTAWVIERGKDLSGKYGAIRVQRGSPAESFIPQFRAAGMQVTEVSKAEHAQAVGQVLDAANSDGLRHLAQPTLNAAVQSAQLQVSGDVEVIGRRTSKADVCGFVAVTIAAGGVPEVKQRSGRVY
jgi:hypothetical protein